MNLFGTISFTARTVGGNNFGGFTFFGWSRFRWVSVFDVVLILDIPLSGGRSGNKHPSSHRASHSLNVLCLMPVCRRREEAVAHSASPKTRLTFRRFLRSGLLDLDEFVERKGRK
jgi:hypothetical protein